MKFIEVEWVRTLTLMFVIYHALPLCRTCGVLEERTENVTDVIRDA